LLKVLSVNWMPDELVAILRAMLPPELELVTAERDQSDQLMEELRNTDVILCADAPVTREMIHAAEQLRLVQHIGVGYDNVDTRTLRERGISLCVTPSGTIVGVAEHTLMLTLAVMRKLLIADAALREGRFLRWQLRTQSYELHGKTLGLIGFGRIGREVAARAKSFGCRILFFDPYARLNLVEQNKMGVAPRSLESVLGEADVVSLHCPLTEDTHKFIGERELRMMKKSAILINTARGKLIDEDALVQALSEGWIAGAGLDVFATEPPSRDHPLFELENVVVTPHIATGTIDSFRAKMDSCLKNIMRLVHREPLREVVQLK